MQHCVTIRRGTFSSFKVKSLWMPLWRLCSPQASVSPRAGCATATLTARTAPMKSPAKRPSASRPSTLVPTTLLCASPPTRSATAKWTARTARTRDPSAVTLAASRLSAHRFASDPLRNAAHLHVRAHVSDHCSVVASTSAPLVWLRPRLKVLSESFYPLSESLPWDLNEHNMFRFSIWVAVVLHVERHIMFHLQCSPARSVSGIVF